MFNKDLVRHSREFRRNVANHKYERTETGILFPSMNAHVGGVYGTSVNDEAWIEEHNIIPDEGLVHVLDVICAAGSQLTSWYMALYTNAYTPTAALTASLFPATAGEIVSGTEGYTEANRVPWLPDAVDAGNTDIINDTTPAEFTIATATSLAVNGAALLSVNTKGSQAGTILSAGRFPAQRNLSATDTFNIKYKINTDAV
jgi:hypothetical protein